MREKAKDLVNASILLFVIGVIIVEMRVLKVQSAATNVLSKVAGHLVLRDRRMQTISDAIRYVIAEGLSLYPDGSLPKYTIEGDRNFGGAVKLTEDAYDDLLRLVAHRYMEGKSSQSMAHTLYDAARYVLDNIERQDTATNPLSDAGSQQACKDDNDGKIEDQEVS